MRPFATCAAAVIALACALAGTTAAGAETLSVAFARTTTALETDKLYRGFLENLSRCTGASLTNHFGQPLFGRLYVAETVPEPQIAALLQERRLQVALVSSASATWLDARGVAEPVALRGQLASQQAETFQLLLLVRADAPATTLAQLAGGKIGFPHARPAAASAGLPLDEQGSPLLDAMLATAALKQAGLTPGRDYTAEYAGGHERAVVGLQGGFWQAAFVAGDQFDRMVKKREAKLRDFKVVWRSPALPTESLVVAKSLPPESRERIARCAQAHRFNAEQTRLFEGSDAFLAADPTLYEAYRKLLPPAGR